MIVQMPKGEIPCNHDVSSNSACVSCLLEFTKRQRHHGSVPTCDTTAKVATSIHTPRVDDDDATASTVDTEVTSANRSTSSKGPPIAQAIFSRKCSGGKSSGNNKTSRSPIKSALRSASKATQQSRSSTRGPSERRVRGLWKLSHSEQEASASDAFERL